MPLLQGDFPDDSRYLVALTTRDSVLFKSFDIGQPIVEQLSFSRCQGREVDDLVLFGSCSVVGCVDNDFVFFGVGLALLRCENSRLGERGFFRTKPSRPSGLKSPCFWPIHGWIGRVVQIQP